MNSFEKLEKEVLQLLTHKLPPELLYHSVDHTLDVIAAAERIVNAEGLGDENMNLVKTAALFHDSGFVIELINHEENSCRIAKEYLKKYEYDDSFIDRICEMIMATKIPQSPKSKVAEILCDADLDYLGREDFSAISHKLYLERKAMGIAESISDWNLKQVDFFNTHHYFTRISIQIRNPQKQKNLTRIKELIEK